MRQAGSLLLAVAAIGFMACYRASFYDGDGKLSDAGWLVIEGHRYELDLGPIDLTTPAKRTYRLSNLPNAQFTVGVEVIESHPNQMNGPVPEHPVAIRIDLRTADGEVAISEDGPLETWVHSYGLGNSKSFYYRRGDARDIPFGNGAATVERLGLKAANGWGSYFTTERSGTYLLTLDLTSPVDSVKRPARLLLHGM